MKKIFSTILPCALLMTVLNGCTKQNENYPEPPKRVYIVNRVPEGTVTLSGTTTFGSSASAKKSVMGGVARVYVNKTFDKDVTVNFTLSGTAVQGQDYNPPAALSATISGGKYYTEINFTVLNNPAQTTSKTVIISLTNATEGFEPGLGSDYKYKIFTYTIVP